MSEGSPQHQPIEDWVPVHDSFLGKELRAVYCSCGNDDYSECMEAQQ